jgi:hypothetical protein
MSGTCRWYKSPEVPRGRYLVPGCWNRAIYGDDADCHCPRPPKRLPKSAHSLLDAIAALNLDLDQLDDAWSYLSRRRALEGDAG